MKSLPYLIILTCVLSQCTREQQTVTQQQASTQKYSVPTFTDSAAFLKMQEAFPIVDKIFKDYAKENHFPAIAFGVIAGGQLVYSGSAGVSNIEKGTMATTKTLFRIASMSKSFTAMAILKLRDEGKLSLSDAAVKYIPELKGAGALTTDAAPITILNLLTMSAGFPEDNPWGDRQLADSDDDLLRLVAAGISFSNVPGTTFEYSNTGFALLGKIVTNVSGMPYDKYITENIMKPIGMTDSKWEYSEVPEEQLALGYRWEDEKWKVEPLLHHGSYGAMGGLICSIEDFTKYVALHVSAWPPRNVTDIGPVRRSSIREMHQPWRMSGLFAGAKTRSGVSCPIAVGYGYGLGWRQDCKGVVRISHSGGLPGFGSEWRFYPEYGIGVVSFSNATYGAPGYPNAVALDTLISIGGLKPRNLPPSEILRQRKEELVRLLPAWSDEEAMKIFAENFFMDQSIESWKKNSAQAFTDAGKILKVSEVTPENQMRGGFVIEGEKKNIRIFFTLTPEAGALVQQLDIEIIEK